MNRTPPRAAAVKAESGIMVLARCGMIDLCVREIGDRWFGLACVGEDLVATAVNASRPAALSDLLRALPKGVARRVLDEHSRFVDDTLAMLHGIESGDEARKRFTLAAAHVREPLASVLRVAAAIPVGYATSYGSIAAAAGTEARVVGAIMAGNPLYPIVPCHRVVGADLALVGYRRSRSAAALDAKLARLRNERRGHSSDTTLDVVGGTLALYPVEWVIDKSEKDRASGTRQRMLFPE